MSCENVGGVESRHAANPGRLNFQPSGSREAVIFRGGQC